MKIYTKTGDKGKTSLFGGKRVDKNNIRIEAYGTVDELNSFIGLLQLQIENDFQHEILLEIQKRLFTLGAMLASDPENKRSTSDLLPSDIKVLEDNIDDMNSHLHPLKTFVLPGGTMGNSLAHVCRTITRRAERRVISLSQEERISDNIIIYLNRLSDYFFILSRYIAFKANHKEIPWTPRT